MNEWRIERITSDEVKRRAQVVEKEKKRNRGMWWMRKEGLSLWGGLLFLLGVAVLTHAL
jgi:hypothetical protein